MRYRVWLFVLATAAGCYAQWPAPKSAMDAYQFVQSRRDEAEKLWTSGNYDRGLAVLKDAMAYLDEPLVVDLAAGNRDLAERRANIYADFAQAYAMQGNKREALAALDKAADLIQYPSAAKWLEQEHHFDSVRGEPEFAAILAKLRRFEHYWDSAALNTPYREDLPDAEKVAGLGKFWSEVKYNFGYPEKLTAMDWDRVYLEEIPKVVATKSTAEYYRELMRMCARIGDGHTNVYPPQQLDVFAKPPLRTGLVEGHVMILEVYSAALEGQGIKAGMEIVEVDGEGAVDYARREVEPYQSASTPQDRENRTFWYGFLRGPAARPVRLKLRDASGEVFEREAARTGYKDVKGRPTLEWRMMGDIAYVALNDFENRGLIRQWHQALPKMAGPKGIIFDLRLNGGGSSDIGDSVMRSLIDRPVVESRVVMRRYNPTERAMGVLMDWTELPASAWTIRPYPEVHYGGPAVVLMGPATFSAAEDFLVAWKNSGRGKMIGEPSGGSTGMPLSFQLPGGGSARVCTKKDTWPDGTEWVGKGIAPDILIGQTAEDVRKGRDAVVARAVEVLMGK